jgi:outer membrane receptor protein involved in Fe transport
MMEKILSRSIRLMCLGGVTLGMQAAYAQTAPAAPAPAAASTAVVQVTGSRIAAPGAESPSPLQVLSSADIAASGATNLQELLLQNPTMGTPAISRTNSNFSTSSAGVATVDLRNLGTSRTLVLLNGRRFVAGIPGESAVDLNTIPTDFIERVELLTGGSSATYGSDAVAGVVNIITKRAFNGILLDAQMGETYEQGDDQKRKASLTFGTSSEDGGSFIMGHLGYSRQGSVMSRDRDFAAVDQYSTGAGVTGDPNDLFSITRPFNSSFAPQGRFFYGPQSARRNFTFDRAGNPIPFSTNGSATQEATGFNRSEYRAIAIPTERFLMAMTGELKLNDNHSAFFEGNYASTRVSTNIEPYPLDSLDIFPASGGSVPAEFQVGNSILRNPIVPQYLYDRAVDSDGDGLRDYSFTRRMADFGNRTSRAERDTFRLATGVKGLILDKYNYEVYGAYGQTKEAQSSSGQVNVLNFRSALEAIPDVDDLNGNGLTTDAICRDANARAQGCVPANVFGANTLSPEAVKYIAAPGSLETVTTQTLVGGSVNGDLWELPAGALSFATGFEWRKEESRATPDALTQAGLNAGNAIPETQGEFSVKEVFIETRVPLLKDVAFAKALNFQGAFRAGDYSTVGRTNSWNAGLEWQPVNDVKFRATRALSTRAPNINELYQAPSQDFPTGIQDPCVGVTATSGGQFAAACRANPGVAANIAANGAFTLNQSDIQGISGYNRGNPDLREEEGRSTTVGIVWTPRSIEALKRFTFTADYFKIKIADAIVGTDRQYALDQCYGGGDQSFCSFITRRATAVGANSAGSLEFIDTAVSNSGGLGTEGVDITASWNDRVGPGRMNARIAYTYVKEAWDRPTPDAEINPFVNEIGAAKNKAIINLGYQWGDFNLQTSVGYIGRSYLDDQFLSQFELPPESKGVGSRTYTDLQLTYALRKSTELYFGLDNVFDTKAPPIISGLPGNTTGAETDAGTYDAIGRRFYVGLRWKL